MNRAVFLDRDGVINRKAPEGQYVTRWEEMHFFPGVAEAIRMLSDASFQVIVISNQRCVAKGLITPEALESLHRRMRDHFQKAGANIDAVYYCPHDYESACDCRKPKPGMLLEAGRNHQIDLSSSWMVGDSETDIQAGKAAGCQTAWVGTTSGANRADVMAESLLDAAQEIVRRTRLS